MSEQLETMSICEKYVIEADRSGIRKYVSRSFPRSFQYTIKLSKSKMFDTKELAERFLDEWKPVAKYYISNPVIKKVSRTFEVKGE